MTVEELREQLIERLTYEFSGMLRGMSGDIDALISAARKEREG